MNRRLENMLRRLEQSIEALDTPQICSASFNGNLRTISQNIKVRELENLITKLAECRNLVSNEQEQEWLNGVGQILKERVNLVFKNSLVSVDV